MTETVTFPISIGETIYIPWWNDDEECFEVGEDIVEALTYSPAGKWAVNKDATAFEIGVQCFLTKEEAGQAATEWNGEADEDE